MPSFGIGDLDGNRDAAEALAAIEAGMGALAWHRGTVINGRMESGPVHGVQKASDCAWQIHYPVVFPVKYRKALLDDEVVQIIT
ncbi:MAG: hypothetical protein VB141_01640, partial [Burkholderia gladioli]